MIARGRRRRRRAERRALRQEAGARIAAWLAAVRRVPPDGFTVVREMDEIPGQARADSWMWCDLLFAPEASPHNEALEARHAFHIGGDEPEGGADSIDLLRHEYTTHGLDLVVTEGRNFVLVEVAGVGAEILRLRPEHRAPAIRRIARAIFGLNRGPVPGIHGQAVEEGTTFSIGGSGADPTLLARCERRADGGICGGSLYFVRYKKAPQQIGYLNGRQWFDDHFRAARAR